MNKTRYSLPRAALPLLPLAPAGMAGPAAAQPRQAAVAQASLIERFVMRPMGRLKAGDEVRFRVRGAADGRVHVDIPGVASGIALRETRSGVYEGSYTIRRTDNLDAFARSTATLQRNGRRDVARVDARDDDHDDNRWARDDRAPQVSRLTPSQHESVSERGRVRIGAKLDDEGRSGVDRDSVRLRVDGRDVTRSARITNDEVEYDADLRPGRHTAELTVRDRAGNLTRRDWNFVVRNDVRDPRPAAQHDPIRLSTHGPLQRVDAEQPFVVRGKTRANAVVHVQVSALTIGYQVVPVETTVRADSRGDFEARLPGLQRLQPNATVNLQVTATPPDAPAVRETVRLHHVH